MNTVSIRVRCLTTRDWPVIEQLFGDNGACGGCWCMWWRMPMGGKTWAQAKGKKNRDAFRRLLKAGRVHGVLAFAGEEPVGWCCFGPRSSFPRIERVRALQRETQSTTWSVVCFYIPSRWRGHGIGTRLAKAATEHAFALGAKEVEGFPVVPKKAPEKVPAAFAWTGVPALFEAAGYEQMNRPDAPRPIYLGRLKP